MLGRLMSNTARAIMEVAQHAGEQGIAMGALVDELERRGFDYQDVELEIWRLLGERMLTPSGFICRTLRKPTATEPSAVARMYEFMLTPWSVDYDQQLELGLDGA